MSSVFTPEPGFYPFIQCRKGSTFSSDEDPFKAKTTAKLVNTFIITFLATDIREMKLSK